MACPDLTRLRALNKELTALLDDPMPDLVPWQLGLLAVLLEMSQLVSVPDSLRKREATRGV